MQIKWTVSALNDLASEMDYLAAEAGNEIAKKHMQQFRKRFQA